MICDIIDKNNGYEKSEIKNYVSRVVNCMKPEEVSVMEASIPLCAEKIKEKIKQSEKIYRKERFCEMLERETIICENSYVLPGVIVSRKTIDSISDSLYEAENGEMNNFEKDLIVKAIGTNNVKWWHRNAGHNSFRINAFINHYPDFIIMTKSGKILIIEAKGDHLDGEDSKVKLMLGRRWQNQAGQKYRYFMVFDKKKINEDGAYTLNEFLDTLKNI